MLTSILHAGVATLAAIGGSAQPAKAALIISDAARRSASPRDDLHDVTGHHRYYGRSACIDSEQFSFWNVG
jgi:hypothetical protein